MTNVAKDNLDSDSPPKLIFAKSKETQHSQLNMGKAKATVKTS